MLIIGLGNPGAKYAQTRHNAGFMLVDYLIKKYHSDNPEKPVRQREDRLYSCAVFDNNLILCKTKTFMNNSGQAVKKIVLNTKYQILDTKYKIPNTLIAHDDLDVPLGKFKIQKGRGPKLHNGIKSVEQHLKTTDFWRIRIGIDSRPPGHRINGERYTLQNFFPEEEAILKKTFAQIIPRLKQPGLVI